MRPGQQHNKRGRSRSRHRSGGSGSSSGGIGGGNPLSRVYESNGPDVKVRGTAQTVAEKYLQLGRDAQSAGDIVMAESYYQYAEHYLRIVTAAQAYSQQNQQQSRRPEEYDDEEGEDGDGEADDSPAPAFAEQVSQPGAQQPDPGNDMLEFESTERSNPQQPYRPPPQRDRDQPAGQPQLQANRERYRPRWQERRDRPPGGEARDTGYQPREQTSQPRQDEQPRITQPPANGNGAEDAGQWEAPSFLRRPAAMPQPLPEPDPSAEAALAPDRKPYQRKPRREKVPATDPLGGSEPPTQAD